MKIIIQKMSTMPQETEHLLRVDGLMREKQRGKESVSLRIFIDQFGINIPATGGLTAESAKFLAKAIDTAAKIQSGELVIEY